MWCRVGFVALPQGWRFHRAGHGDCSCCKCPFLDTVGSDNGLVLPPYWHNDTSVAQDVGNKAPTGNDLGSRKKSRTALDESRVHSQAFRGSVCCGFFRSQALHQDPPPCGCRWNGKLEVNNMIGLCFEATNSNWHSINAEIEVYLAIAHMHC